MGIEGDSGSTDDKSPRANWETPPRHVRDISQVPVGKLEDAYNRRGTQVNFGAPQKDGSIPADVNRVSVEGMPTKRWWQFWKK